MTTKEIIVQRFDLISEHIKWPKHIAYYLWRDGIIDETCFKNLNTSGSTTSDKVALLILAVLESGNHEATMDSFLNALRCTAQTHIFDELTGHQPGISSSYAQNLGEFRSAFIIVVALRLIFRS